MHCFVSGASGYVGRALTSALLNRGDSVIAQYRRGQVPAGANSLQHDFHEPLPRLELEGVDAVYHLAGIAHQRASAEEYEALNVRAASDMAQLALESGTQHFVLVSSVLAGRPDQAGNLSYGRSKALAEAGVRRVLGASSVNLHIVRPALVYSDDAPGHLALLRGWCQRHLPRPPDLGGRSMIAREDLVELLLLLSERSAIPGRDLPLVASDGEIYTARRMYDAFAKSAGVRPWLPSPPDFAWRFGCSVLDLIQGEEAGAFWHRFAAEEVYEPQGLKDVGFRTSLTLETTLR
ncbi:MAG: NAD-dependent epimerase/dehydratase family protein [Pseudomonadota bacterium]